MSVITYTKDGVADIKALICNLVKDLTGQGSPAVGTAAEHMKLIYPEDFDPSDPDALADDVLVILESTTNIDPFARTDITVEDPSKDPWRIAFHTSKWKARSSATLNDTGNAWPVTPNNIEINSLAVYVGTPSTLYVKDGNPIIGWITTQIGSRFQRPQHYKYGGTGTAGWTSKFNAGGNDSWKKWKFKTSYSGRDMIEPVGNTGAQWTNTFDPTPNNIKLQTATSGTESEVPAPYTSPALWDGPDVEDPNQLFINKWVVAGVSADAFGGSFKIDSNYSQPVSYRIVLTDHGIFLGCWGPDPEENGKGFSWILVQRPVDKNTGIVRNTPPDPANTGNRPLFCVNSVNGKYWKFVVREHDNPVPSNRKDAAKSTADSGAVINPYQQQSLTENGEYVITFLNNLNSSRFKYADELDMLGTVSSDVVGGGNEIQVNVYGEKDTLNNLSARTYHALWSSGSFGTKMRIMVVKDIPDPNTPV